MLNKLIRHICLKEGHNPMCLQNFYLKYVCGLSVNMRWTIYDRSSFFSKYLSSKVASIKFCVAYHRVLYRTLLYMKNNEFVS